MQKVILAIRLIRLHNCLLAGASVWLGGYLAGENYQQNLLLLASIAIGLVCGAGNALNDYWDIEVDRINHPQRPLPAGKLPPYFAILVAAIFNLAAVILGIFCGFSILGIIIIFILLLVVYNFRLKKVPLLGNLIISILSGTAFLIGGMAVSSDSLFIVPGPIVPAVFAFLFHFGRELVKDMADFRGDTAADYHTLPSLLSSMKIIVLISMIFALLIALTLIPILRGWYQASFGIITVTLVDVPLVLIMVLLWYSQMIDKYRLAGSILKFLMIFGLMAFALGKQ